jgi:nicotinate-nucleotide adenylyltransferase
MQLGIMGGTFDPIHLGHLQIARAAMREAGLDRVIFLPDGNPPHKSPGASGADRFTMVCLALEDQHGFSASNMELLRAGNTYTVDTLLELRRRNPAGQLAYIIGADTLYQFPTWKTAERVAQLCRLLVIPRPGCDLHEIKAEQQRLAVRYGLVTALLSTQGPDISSSRVRDAVAQGKPIDAMVPRAVARYIKEKGLYLRGKED